MSRVGKTGWVRTEVSGVESPRYLAMGKTEVGPRPQRDLSSHSISLVMQFGPSPDLFSPGLLLVMWQTPLEKEQGDLGRASYDSHTTSPTTTSLITEPSGQ